MAFWKLGRKPAADHIAVFSVSDAHAFQRDLREAARWLERSMEFGNAKAAFYLATLLIEEAVRAFHRPAELGFPTAETLLAHSAQVHDQEILFRLVATAWAFDPSLAPSPRPSPARGRGSMVSFREAEHPRGHHLDIGDQQHADRRDDQERQRFLEARGGEKEV